ncbi:MAG: hypothetical protein CML68_25150 [Rhodobacteraceae bacterium]|nr:hypothetical protein [Paracoccaceae bacterium]
MVNVSAPRAPRVRGPLAVSLIVLATASLAVTGCGKRSVVGTAVNATTSAVSTAANVAGAAVSTTANVAGAAVSTTANVAGAATSAATSAVSSGTSAAAAGTSAAAASTSSGVITPAVVGATVGLGLAAGLDQDSRTIDAAAQAEGAANCLRAGGSQAQAAQLLASAGWADAGIDNGMRVFTKNDVRGLLTTQGHCLFRTEFTTPSEADTAVRGLVDSLYPGGLRSGAPNGGSGLCNGFTVAAERNAWIHYTDSTGAPCGGLGSGVTVQVL